MSTSKMKAGLLAFVMAAALTAGCGQKAGVNTMVAGPGGQVAVGGTGVDPALGVPVDGAGVPVDGLGGPGGGAAGIAGSTGGLASGGGSGTGSTTSGGGSSPDAKDGGQVPGAPSPEAPQGPGDRTGVTDSTIKIGVHAPVTGAAAFPQASFERGIGVYADYINRKGGIHGRKIQIVFRDDKFDPNAARSVCKEMAEQEKVFMLVGGGGADQIDACARYASALGVPYLSAGVHETRPGLGSLGALRTYFATSLTYEQQAPLLSRLVASEFKGQKVALLVADNDSLDNFYAISESSLKKVAGSNLVLARRIPKKTDVDAPAIGTQICNSGAKAVVWNASPSGLINVSKSMACQVSFLGPGLTAGLNIVATAGCPNIDRAQFYSPFPGLDKIDQVDPTFRPAYRQKTGQEPDDIGIAVWGLEKLIGLMLQASGKDLTREGFMATIAKNKSFNSGVYPTTNFGSRFGGTAMHLLQADCSARQYRTKRLNERP